MEKATTEISEDNENSFKEENPPYFDEDIPGTSEIVGYPNDLVDVQGSFSDPDKAFNSSSEESKDHICSCLSSDSEDYISSLEGEGSETEEVST